MLSLQLLWLLLLCCHESGLIDEQRAVQLTVQELQDHIEADDSEGESADSDVKTKTSSCQPLGKFVTCFHVVMPVFIDESIEIDFRSVDLPLNKSMTAFGRPFRLRLDIDALSGEADELKSEMTWSSVISPSTVVSVEGENGTSMQYSTNDMKIKWYVGKDDFEVAPSSVLATTVVNLKGQRLFRGVIHTTSEVYYIEPALDYPQVYV